MKTSRTVVQHLSLNGIIKVIRRPAFWFIAAVFVLITIPHYGEVQAYPGFITSFMTSLGLSRHAFERILYMAPIVWAGFLFGWRGAFISSLVALACMLPRVFLLSTNFLDAIFETSAVFVVSNALAISFASLRKEREYRVQLETTQQELLTSERRYRQLFENAQDAIWIHDLNGNIVTANKATEKLTGYNLDELIRTHVRNFLSEESLHLAGQIRQKLLANEQVEQPYEQHLLKKDGEEVIVQLATSLIYDNNQPSAFQHIARDITEQKRMQDNLNFYLRQITKAQEEERKRISRELHDDTIQALIVLSRQLDALTSDAKGLSEENRLNIENLWQQTDNIIQGIRHLSQDLRPAALDRLGLLPALERLTSDVTQYSGIVTSLDVNGTERRFPEEIELLLFRIIQEALSNIRRHSHATEANVKIQFNNDSIKVTINDNGKGFDLPKNIGDLTRDGKLGIAGMQERVRLINGKLIMHSKSGKGTEISVEVPMQS